MKTPIRVILPVLFCVAFFTGVRGQDVPSALPEYDLKVNLINKKGKPFKAARVAINVAGKDGVYHADETGSVIVPGVQADDVLNVFAGETLFNVEVGGYDSLNIVFRSHRSMSKAYGPDETYNTGFGEISRRQNTEAYASVDMREAENARSLLEYLTGRVAGLEVTGNTIRIRGITTFHGSNEPLVVVDGNIMDIRTANDLVLPSHISSITVDKTGALYGVRGANGVIIITTKRGGEGR